MSNLLLESIKDSHTILNSTEHDMTIFLNTLHFCLSSYYVLYEILNYCYTFFNHPKLPTFNPFSSKAFGSYTEYICTGFTILSTIGSWEGLYGCANWRLGHSLLGCLACTPFVIYDIYILVLGRFHSIKINDFLLFQTLLTSTIRTLRIVATIGNLSFIIHVSIKARESSLSLADFI